MSTVSILAMTACGDAAQAENASHTGAAIQKTNGESQTETTLASAKTAESTKTEEKSTVANTVAPTEADNKTDGVTAETQTKESLAPSTVQTAATIDFSDYNGLTLDSFLSYEEQDETALENFVNGVGLQEVAYGETADLSKHMDFSNCSSKTIVDIGDLIAYEFCDSKTPVSTTSITAVMLNKNYSKYQYAFELDKDNHKLNLYINYIK
ncbi:MAG: hypothetical protein MRZ64_11845 [[Bacteroides] pectinophilus]|nr:hypothetical protein [[Bacteroides] pectinophilus]